MMGLMIGAVAIGVAAFVVLVVVTTRSVKKECEHYDEER
jgi:hypothetical protein